MYVEISMIFGRSCSVSNAAGSVDLHSATAPAYYLYVKLLYCGFFYIPYINNKNKLGMYVCAYSSFAIVHITIVKRHSSGHTKS